MKKKPTYEELDKKIDSLNTKARDDTIDRQNKIVDSINDGIYINSPDYTIEYLNSPMIKLIGGDKTGEKCYKAIYGKDDICEWCVFEQQKKGESIVYELKHPVSNKYFSIKSFLLDNGSKVSTYHDINEIKKNEIEIKVKNEEYASLNKEYLATNEQLLCSKSKIEESELILKERVKELNGLHSLSLLRYEYDNIGSIYQKFINTILTESMQFPDKVFAKLEHNGKVYTNIEGYNLPEGQKHLSANIIIKGLEVGKLTIGYTEDLPFIDYFEQRLIDSYARELSLIIEKNEAEYEHRRSIDISNISESTAKLGSWQWDLKTSFVKWSDNMCAIHGISPEEFGDNFETAAKFIHPDDMDLVSENIRKMLQEKKERNFYYRIITKLRTEKYVFGTNKLCFDDDNNIIEVIGSVQDITEARKRELQLKEAISAAEENEISFRKLFEKNPVSLWEEDFTSVRKLLLDKKSKVKSLEKYLDKNPEFVLKCASSIEIISVNEATLDLLGVEDKEELINNIDDTFNDKSYITFKKELLAIADGSKSFKGETEFIRADGTFITAIIQFVAIDDYSKVIVSISDITYKKKIEVELQKQNAEFSVLNREYRLTNEQLIHTKNKVEESELRFKALHNASFGGIAIHDKGIILDCNQGLAEISGFKVDELIGMDGLLLIEENSRAKVMENILASYELAYESLGVRKNGEVYPLRLEARAIPYKGKTVRVVEFRDITNQKEAENELLEAKERAEESDKLKTEFINNMSHEIRTPMNGILGFSSFLNNDELSSEKRKQYVKVIQNSGKQLMRIIDDILEISKLGTKQVKAIDEEICLNDLLLEQFSIFDITAKENKIPLYLKKGLSDVESFIFTDKTKLNKILSNLLENALKFTNEGYIEFGYKLKEDSKHPQLEIFVKDTGIGIQSQNLKTIFNRFSQEEKELSRSVGGLGLGLSIAKENAELLGGNITLKSKKGEGSTFCITIPYRAVKPKSKKESSDFGIEGKQDIYTVLIAEDEEINFLYIETLLEHLDVDIKILHAKHGEEAIEICKENSNIDLVLMDLKMPIMTGFKATRLIKVFRPQLPIIAQTAYSTREERHTAILAGCDDFISKPIRGKELSDVVTKYMLVES